MLHVHVLLVCGNFILPEPASYVFFYAIFNLRKLLYIIIGKAETQTVCCGEEADRSQAQGEAIAERAETADQNRENPSALHSCRNVGDLFERADRPDR